MLEHSRFQREKTSLALLRGLDIFCLVESWHNCEDDLQCPPLHNYSFYAVNRKVSKNNRYYGGVVMYFSQTSFSSAVRLATQSENIVWGRFNCESTFLIVGSVYLAPQNSSYSSEDTWTILHEETRLIQQKFPGDRLVVVGDFNAYTSNVLEITPEFFQMIILRSFLRSLRCHGAVTISLEE